MNNQIAIYQSEILSSQIEVRPESFREKMKQYG